MYGMKQMLSIAIAMLKKKSTTRFHNLFENGEFTFVY